MTQHKKTIRKEPKQLNPTQPIFFDDIVVSLAGIGDLVDVHFKIDPKMRMPGPFYIIDEKTSKIGRPASMPKIGKIASGRSKTGSIGFGIFLNPDDEIKPGSLITLVSGGYIKEHITVT
jgi:hypothetical protein